MADPGDPDYHLRNLILPEDYAERVLEWHGGQGSYAYSLGSTGMSNFVSASMIDAAVGELERDQGGSWMTKEQEEELEKLIGDLDMVARFSSEFTAEEANSRYATWLMEEGEVVSNPKGMRKLKNRLMT